MENEKKKTRRPSNKKKLVSFCLLSACPGIAAWEGGLDVFP